MDEFVKILQGKMRGRKLIHKTEVKSAKVVSVEEKDMLS